MNIHAHTPQFQGRFRSMFNNPRSQNVALGVSSAGGGTFTVAGQASAAYHGYPVDALNFLSGLVNTGVGLHNIRANGGLKQLKDPDQIP